MKRIQFIHAIAACMSVTISAKITEITSSEQFNSLIAEKPALVKFSAVWCGPCKAVKPKFESISNDPEYAHVAFLAVDIDKQERVASLYGVTSIPTFIYFNNGKEAHRSLGADNFVQQTKQDLNKYLKKSPVADTTERNVAVTAAQEQPEAAQQPQEPAKKTVEKPAEPVVEKGLWEQLVDQVQSAYNWVKNTISSWFN